MRERKYDIFQKYFFLNRIKEFISNDFESNLKVSIINGVSHKEYLTIIYKIYDRLLILF